MKLNLETRFAADRIATYVNGCVIAVAAYLTSAYLAEPAVLGCLVASAGLTVWTYQLSKDEKTHRKIGANVASATRCFQAVALGATLAHPGLRSTGVWALASVPLFVEGFCRGSLIGSALVTATAVSVEAYGAALSHHIALASMPAISATVAAVTGYAISRHIVRESMLGLQNHRLSALLECGADLAESCDLRQTMLHNLKTAVHETNASFGYIMLVDDSDNSQLVTEIAYGVEGEFDFPERASLGSGIAGYVAKVGQAVAITGDDNDFENFGNLPAGVRSAASIPLTVRTHSGGGEATVEEMLGVATLFDTKNKNTFTNDNMELLRSLGSLISVAVANAKMEERRRTTFLLTLESLATALEARDEYTRGHSQRVCEVSLMIGEQLGYGPEAMEELRVGTILHDIGKIGVPDAILNKRARLTDEEFAIMKSHPVIGYEICRPLMLSDGVLMIIRNHHEKLDGSGYPDGLKGGELPLSLRVVCAADAFDAMSSRRPYRSVMETSTVLAELSKGAGTQFDPVVVEILKDLMASDRLLDLYREHWGEGELRAA